MGEECDIVIQMELNLRMTVGLTQRVLFSAQNLE